MTARPPYATPSMADIAKVRGTNGLRIVSTFSGCGGSCLGFEMAGYEVLAASEFVEAARDTYELNHPGVPIDPRDVRDITPESLLAFAGISAGELDVLEGSPPCSSFSTAGKGSKGWGQVKSYSDTKQRTDDLFFEFARLLEGIQPRAFIAENVAGLIRGNARGYFKLIMRRLRECGYLVEAKLLDAQWLGVPQRRRRLIFQGIRLDLELAPAWPTPLPYRYSLADVLSHAVLHDTYGQHSIGDVTEGPSPTILAGGSNSHHYQVLTRRGDVAETAIIDPWVDDGLAIDPETGERIDLKGTALYEDWKRNQGGAPTRYINSTFAEDRSTSPTVTAAGGSARGTAAVMIAASPRKFTLQELRRICGFPDDFQLTGSYAQRWERLGRAVPPPMMAAVARSLATVLT